MQFCCFCFSFVAVTRHCDLSVFLQCLCTVPWWHVTAKMHARYSRRSRYLVQLISYVVYCQYLVSFLSSLCLVKKQCFTCLLQKDTQYEKLTEFQSSSPISYEWLVCCICLLISWHFKGPYFRFQLHCVVLTFYSPLIHPVLHISPNCSLYLHSHHLSLPQSFIPDSRPISSTNIFLHVCANQFYCAGSVLSSSSSYFPDLVSWYFIVSMFAQGIYT